MSGREQQQPRAIISDDDEQRTKELVAEIKRGNQHAFTELVRKYRAQVGALAYKMVSDYDEAADITQNVFVKVADNIWRYDEKRKFYTWLYRIAINASIDYIRKHKRHRHEQLDDLHEKLDSLQTDPEFDYIRRRIEEHIFKAADKLNPKQRSAFMLRDVQGRKIDDVAHMMQMPEATVRWYLHRARTRVRKELTRRCPQLLALLGIR